MSYFRRGMGDGPITSPSQVDDQVATISDVAPTRVDCEQLPSDSEWRRPGQVCATPSGGGVMDYLLNTIRSAISPQAPASQPASSSATMPSLPPADGSGTTALLLLAGAAVGGYYLFFHKKGRTR